MSGTLLAMNGLVLIEVSDLMSFLGFVATVALVLYLYVFVSSRRLRQSVYNNRLALVVTMLGVLLLFVALLYNTARECEDLRASLERELVATRKKLEDCKQSKHGSAGDGGVLNAVFQPLRNVIKGAWSLLGMGGGRESHQSAAAAPPTPLAPEPEEETTIMDTAAAAAGEL